MQSPQQMAQQSYSGQRINFDGVRLNRDDEVGGNNWLKKQQQNEANEYRQK